VPEHVSIAYRGANYAIGQGPHFYGIWHAAAPQAQPLEWWPLTPEGWTAAWMRFASIEVPGTITAVTAPPGISTTPPGMSTPPVTAVSPSASGSLPSAVTSTPPVNPARAALLARFATVLLAVGIVLGVVGLFPTYTDGASLASQPPNLWPHLIYLAAWAVSAGLILFSGVRRQAGTLIGLGVSAVTFGLFFADAGTPMSGGTHLMGAGLILGIVGWLACTIGVAVAFPASGLSLRGWALGRRAGGRPARHTSHDIVPIATTILAAIGAAIAFAPSWDSYLLRTASGASQTVTAGNAFASVNPVPVIIGDVLVMVALVAVVAAAAFWRPTRLGAALTAGAIIPMVAQAVSAFVQVREATSPLQFGVSPSQASGVGLTITNGLTPMFWVYCAFLATLILLCVWMLLASDATGSQAVPYATQPNLGSGASSGPAQPMQAGLVSQPDAQVTGPTPG